MLSSALNSAVAQPRARAMTTDATPQSVAWLQARRAYAFDIGEELAQQRVISADAYLFLYKELVRLCKERALCWPGLPWLAARLGTSIGTIKRWLDELVKAMLIRRKPRPGGQTTLTIVSALDSYDAAQADSACAQPTPPYHVVPETTAPDDAARPPAPLFFVPKQRITPAPAASAPLIPHTIKRQKLKSFDVGCTEKPSDATGPQVLTNAVTAALLQAGLTDPQIINELHAEPLGEIEAIIGYVARQRHIDNPPGLIVTLARNHAGAALVRRSHRGVLAGRQRGVAHHSPSVTLREPTEQPGTLQLRAQLQAAVAPELWEVWFRDIHLLDIMESTVVLGVANCLTRDYLQAEHLPVLIAAVAAVVGQPPTLEFAITATP